MSRRPPDRRRRKDRRIFDNERSLEIDWLRLFWPANERRGLSHEDVLRLAEPQVRFVFGSRRRYQLLYGSRGGGKTWVLALKAIYLALANPGVEGAIFGRTWTEAEHGRLMEEFWAHVERILEATGIDIVEHHHRQAKYVRLINGSKIHIKGYEGLNLRKGRGGSLGWLVVDEVDWSASSVEDIFEAMQKLVREPCPLPQVVYGTSPQGAQGIAGLFASRIAGEDRKEASRYFVTFVTAANNPHIDGEEYQDLILRGSSVRQGLQEGYGFVLTPEETIYSEFDPHRHIIPHVWRNDWPWILALDWGQKMGAGMAIQVDPVTGRWVVARELDGAVRSEMEFRERVVRFVDDIGSRPLLVAADRACRQENNWARSYFGLRTEVLTCETRQQQSIQGGIAKVRYMLDPIEGPPRLYFADTLENDPYSRRGIVWSMLNYSYAKGPNGTILPFPSTVPDDPARHSVDALRYAVEVSAQERKWHGGRVLPYVDDSRPVFTPRKG